MGEKIMKYGFLAAGLIISLIALSCGAVKKTPAENKAAGPGVYASIDAENAFQMMKSENINLVIIDVGTPFEFSGSHIVNSVNISYNPTNFKEEISKLDKNGVYLIYCHSGNKSNRALAEFQELDFQSVYSLFGGIMEWSLRGFPVAR
jgi:rhodanese-related sulfurtransferase